MISNRLCVLLLSVTLAVLAAQAQFDTELQSLINIVKTLRVQNQGNYNHALEQLRKDKMWTPMNETGRIQDGKECSHDEKVSGFRLNGILNKVSKGRVYVAANEGMLNGSDERYNYSLYERSLKAKKSATYKFRGRVGKQTFVIIPYKAKGSGLTATLTISGETVQGKGDDIIVIETTNPALKSDTEISLVVSNASAQSQSFVIINHNTRKK